MIVSPFGSASTALDVIEGIELTGKRAIVTGASTGIGVETARALAAAGAEVTLAVQDPRAGERVAENIRSTSGNTRVAAAAADLADLESVATFAAHWDGALDILVNNAEVLGVQERTLTNAGHELHLAANHLGHFALAIGLRDALAATGGARIVSVSSSGHLLSPVVFDDLHYDFREYDPLGAYGQSKTANILFAVEATRLWTADGITANALMPGSIDTGLQRQVGGSARKTIEQGAATSVFVATWPPLDGVGGRCFQDCREAPVVSRRRAAGVAPYALDPDNAQRLWELSRDLIAQ